MKGKRKHTEKAVNDTEIRVETAGQEVSEPETECKTTVFDPMDQVREIERERDEWKDKFLRSAAEFENFRRRTTDEKSAWIRSATQQLVLELCDVMDNFERALATGEGKPEIASFFDGVKLIWQQLDNVMKKEGVEKVDSMDKPFDPMVHEAISQIPSDKPANTVIAVVKNGYIMNKKVIRPAQVVLAMEPVQ